MDTEIENKLKSLLNLQHIHNQIDNVEKLKGELPMEVKDLEDEIQGLETRREKLRNDINQLEDEIINKKNKIQLCEDKSANYLKQMDDVKNNREFEALSKELEIQKLDIQIAEKNIKEFTDKIAIDTEKYEEVQAIIDKKTNDLEEKKPQLEQILQETQKELDELNEKASKVEELVEDRLFAAYKRLRSNFKNKKAVAFIERNACSGCFCEIPPQRQVEIRQRKKINACEHCGRIILDKKVDEEIVKEKA